jgi:hypothetical protein
VLIDAAKDHVTSGYLFRIWSVELRAGQSGRETAVVTATLRIKQRRLPEIVVMNGSFAVGVLTTLGTAAIVRKLTNRLSRRSLRLGFPRSAARFRAWPLATPRPPPLTATSTPSTDAMPRSPQHSSTWPRTATPYGCSSPS